MSAMDLVPSVVTPKLAAAALASPFLADAVRLADWIGDGKEMTSAGTLPPALAREALELLGVELPEGIPEDEIYEPLEAVLDNAAAAGFITVSDELASAADLPTDPEQVLRRWLSVVLKPFGMPDQPCAECITVLSLLEDDSPRAVSVQTLVEVVSADFSCAGQDQDEESYLAMRSARHTVGTVSALRGLGAVIVTELGHPENNMVRLAPLGRMLADTVFAALTPAPDEMAGSVIYLFGQLTPRIATKIGGPWLASRTTADVAREVLDFAAYARADLRTIAAAFVSSLGAEAAPAWRERVKDRRIGVYARSWLVGHGENVPMDGREADWSEVEELSAQVAAVSEPILVSMFANLGTDPDALLELRRVLNRSRHPDAPRLMDVLERVTGRSSGIARIDPPPAVVSTPTGTVCRLRISLRHVDNPAVTRTVAVDAGTTLAELHEIIQTAMGWEDVHPHGFSFGPAEVAEAAPLGRLLKKPGDRIDYTYDFGDDWEHDIIVEDFSHNDIGDTLPALIDGSGACPPEDCGGAPGFRRLKEIMADPRHEEHDKLADWLAVSSFDPAAFWLDSAAASVARVGQPSPAARCRPVTVVRVQPKRKKRRR